MRLSEVASKVVDLSDKIREYYEAGIPKWYRNYPLLSPGEVDPPPPAPEEQELLDLLRAVPDEIVYQLLLIIYLGRGDFRVDDLAPRFAALPGEVGSRDRAISLMTGFSPLLDYLSDGLTQLRKHKVNLDKLPLKLVKARKQ